MRSPCPRLTGELCILTTVKRENDPVIHCAGFKYIGNTALHLEAEGYDVIFGYEEAIGFMIGSTVRDKDGVAATVSILHGDK